MNGVAPLQATKQANKSRGRSKIHNANHGISEAREVKNTSESSDQAHSFKNERVEASESR